MDIDNVSAAVAFEYVQMQAAIGLSEKILADMRKSHSTLVEKDAEFKTTDFGNSPYVILIGGTIFALGVITDENGRWTDCEDTLVCDATRFSKKAADELMITAVNRGLSEVPKFKRLQIIDIREATAAAILYIEKKIGDINEKLQEAKVWARQAETILK